MSETSKDGQLSQPSRSPDLRSLHTKLMQAARATGILPEDPLYVIITAFVDMLGFMDDVSERSDHNARESSQRIFDAVAGAKTAADAEQKRFEAAMKAAQARTIADVSEAIAESAEAALTKRVRLVERKLVLVGAVIFFVAGATAVASGYYWGNKSAESRLASIVAESNKVAFLNNDSFKQWIFLAAFNDDIKSQVQNCFKPNYSFPKEGRKACNFTLWVEAAPPLR